MSLPRELGAGRKLGLGLADWRSWAKILVGDSSVVDDGLYLLCTERCVDGRYFPGGSVVSRWGIRGEVFFRGAKRGGPGRTVRILW
jgi:hypothetical protein